jgi:hypothetical protein
VRAVVKVAGGRDQLPLESRPDRLKVRPQLSSCEASQDRGSQFTTSTMRELVDARLAWDDLSGYSSVKDLKSALFDAEEELAIVTGLRSLCWKVG